MTEIDEETRIQELIKKETNTNAELNEMLTEMVSDQVITNSLKEHLVLQYWWWHRTKLEWDEVKYNNLITKIKFLLSETPPESPLTPASFNEWNKTVFDKYVFKDPNYSFSNSDFFVQSFEDKKIDLETLCMITFITEEKYEKHRWKELNTFHLAAYLIINDDKFIKRPLKLNDFKEIIKLAQKISNNKLTKFYKNGKFIVKAKYLCKAVEKFNKSNKEKATGQT